MNIHNRKIVFTVAMLLSMNSAFVYANGLEEEMQIKEDVTNVVTEEVPVNEVKEENKEVVANNAEAVTKEDVTNVVTEEVPVNEVKEEEKKEEASVIIEEAPVIIEEAPVNEVKEENKEVVANNAEAVTEETPVANEVIVIEAKEEIINIENNNVAVEKIEATEDINNEEKTLGEVIKEENSSSEQNLDDLKLVEDKKEDINKEDINTEALKTEEKQEVTSWASKIKYVTYDASINKVKDLLVWAWSKVPSLRSSETKTAAVVTRTPEYDAMSARLINAAIHGEDVEAKVAKLKQDSADANAKCNDLLQKISDLQKLDDATLTEEEINQKQEDLNKSLAEYAMFDSLKAQISDLIKYVAYGKTIRMLEVKVKLDLNSDKAQNVNKLGDVLETLKNKTLIFVQDSTKTQADDSQLTEEFNNLIAEFRKNTSNVDAKLADVAKKQNEQVDGALSLVSLQGIINAAKAVANAVGAEINQTIKNSEKTI